MSSPLRAGPPSQMAPPRHRPVVFSIEGPIAPSDLPGLCRRVRGVLDGSGARTAVCDVGAGVEADAVAVDALARLQLLARRLGCRVVLRGASDELLALLDFLGLQDVAPCRPTDPGGTESEPDGAEP